MRAPLRQSHGLANCSTGRLLRLPAMRRDSGDDVPNRVRIHDQNPPKPSYFEVEVHTSNAHLQKSFSNANLQNRCCCVDTRARACPFCRMVDSVTILQNGRPFCRMDCSANWYQHIHICVSATCIHICARPRIERGLCVASASRERMQTDDAAAKSVFVVNGFYAGRASCSNSPELLPSCI